MTNPFADLIAGGGSGNPFADLVTDTGSALGRKQTELNSLQNNIDTLKNIRQRANPDQQKRIDKMIADLEGKKEKWYKFSGESRLSDIPRGAAAGIAGAPMTIADLALTVPDLLGSDAARAGRTAIAENRAAVNEVLDPRGVAGAAAEFAGELPGQMLAFGPLDRAVLGVAGKIIPKAAPLLTGPVAGGFARRAAVEGTRNVVANAPVAAAQVATMEGATPQDKLRQFLIAETAAGGFGAVSALRGPAKAKTGEAGKTAPAESTVPAEATSGTQILDELNLKAAAQNAKREEAKKIQNLAAAEWVQQNGGKSWKGDLTNEQRKEVVKAFKARYEADKVASAAGVTSDPPTAPVIPIAEQAAEVARKELAIAEATGSKAATDAAAKKVETTQALAAEPPPPPAPVVPPVPRPTLDKSTAGVSPAVADLIRRKSLKEQFARLGLEWDDTKPLDVAERQIEAVVKQNLRGSAAPKTQAEIIAERMATPPVAEKIDAASLTPEIRQKLIDKGHAMLAELDAEPDGNTPRAIQLKKDIDVFTQQLTDLGILPKENQFGQEPAQSGVLPAIKVSDIVSPAVKDIETGQVTSGTIHADAMATAGKPREAFIQGYITKDGRFIDYPTADAIAAKEDVSLDHGPVSEPSARSDAAALTEPAGGIASSPPRAVAVAVAEQKPKGTFLKLLNTKKPLEELTTRQLDQIETKLADAAQGSKDEVKWKKITDDLALVRTEMAKREMQVAATPERPHADLSPDDLLIHRDAVEQTLEDISARLKTVPTKERTALRAEQKATQARLEEVKKEINLRKSYSPPEAPTALGEGGPVVVPKVFDFKKEPSRLGDADLKAQIDEIDSRLSVIDPKDAKPWQERLTALMDEQASRAAGKPAGPDGMPPVSDGKGELRLQSHPAVNGFAVGFTTGIFAPMPEEDEESRLSRAFMWGLGSAGVTMGAKYLLARQKVAGKPEPSKMIPGADQFDKRVYAAEDLEGAKIGTLARLRQFYGGLVRSIDAIERIPFRKDLPTQNNPAKLAEMHGSYAAQAERWFTSKVDFINPKTGNPEPILIDGQETKPLSYIIDTMADGDKEALGDLAVALSSAELSGRMPENRLPMPKLQYEWIISHAPEKLIAAAKELRRFNLAGAEVQRRLGLISDETFAKFATEDWYTPLHRVVEQMEGLSKVRSDRAPAKSALFARKGGSNKPVLNPVDVTMNMTVRILRSAEYNNTITTLVDRIMELPKDIRSMIIQPVGKQLNKHALNVDGVEVEMRKWANISMADAKAMLAYMDSDAIHGKPGVISHFKNGEIQSYRVNSDLFQAVKALSPQEMEMAWRILGFPARLASKGVVYHPSFVATQFIVDTFHGALLSEYGFRPGIDSIRGWWNEFRGSKKYQDMLAAGGPTSLQSLPYLAKETRGEAIRLAADKPYELMWKQMKELKVWEAYKTFALPLANAARVGEYLRALDHGASTIEAAYAAQNLIGNYRMQGSFGAMRVFNYLTMFSRPAISAMDKTLERSGVLGILGVRHARYSHTAFGQAAQKLGVNSDVAAALAFMTKGTIGISIPTMMLWYINKDDDEINQVRRTPMGQRYWFFRAGPDEIIRVRRPQVIGEIFGSSAEAMLDKMYNDDPEGTNRLMGALWDDAALNVLPQVGVVPLSIWANKKTGFGSPIIPERDDRMDPNFQGRSDASLPSRVISDLAAPVSQELELQPLRTALSPAGLDYIFGTLGGMIGQDGLRGLNAALVYQQKGYLPAKEELPITARLVARYPSMNVKEVQGFYKRDRKVQASAGTIKEYIQSKPELLGDYYTNNMERIQLIKLHDEVRQKVADLRRAIDDLKNAPEGMFDRSTVEQTTKTMTEIIIKHMKTANDAAKMLEQSK